MAPATSRFSCIQLGGYLKEKPYSLFVYVSQSAVGSSCSNSFSIIASGVGEGVGVGATAVLGFIMKYAAAVAIPIDINIIAIKIISFLWPFGPPGGEAGLGGGGGVDVWFVVGES
jgi:hypothetical protein